MECMQLLIKDAREECFEDWIMSIYYSQKEKESQSFRVFVSEEDSGEEFFDFYVKDYEAFRTDILELSRSEYVQIIIGNFVYSQKENEVKRLKSYVENMIPCIDIEDTEYGIAIFNGKIGKDLGITSVKRMVEIVTI